MNIFVRSSRTLLIASILVLFVINNVYAGRIVVNNDEWTLSNTGFTQSPDAAIFAVNIASFLAGSGGSIHAYSNNFGFTESSLDNTLTGAGFTYSTGTGISFDLPTLSSFDAIFLTFPTLDATQVGTLIDYVDAGGSVYLAGGASFSNPSGFTAAWNPLLNEFGLTFASNNNGINGNIDVSTATHPIFDEVNTLYQASGNSISGPGVVFSLNGQGLYAVDPVPLPAAVWLFASGLLALFSMARRKKVGL